jgi:subtilisin family serine protease
MGLTAVELSQAQQATGFKEANDITIAVIDSGVDSGHPDLQGVIFDEQNFTRGARQDTSGHGTHVCGIIAAVRNNRIGIAGVCQSRRLISLKALSPYDGPGYYRAIRYATDNGAQVINFSLGGGRDQTEELLIKRAIAKGIVIVAAIGNDFLRGNPTSYPAALPDVISVGASTEVDRRASFSGTGPHMDLVAPGDNILSTVPTYPSSLTTVTDYDSWPGTSMATPFVTATVALMLAKRPNATLPKIVDAMHQGCDPIAGQVGFTQQLGHGRLNIRKTLARI